MTDTRFADIEDLNSLLNKISQDTDLTSESHRYDFPPKSQEKKTPPDVKFPPDDDIKIQYNDTLKPTTVPAEGIEKLKPSSNTVMTDNDQIDMAHPNKSATINFRDVITLDELIKTALPQLQYQIYCDLDGVLVDFDRGFEKFFGEGRPLDFIEKYSKSQFWKKMYTKPRFFRDLDWMPDGQALWSYVQQLDPIILTAPARSMEYCATDKMNWVKENLGEGVKTIVTEDKAQFATGNSILIDDRDKNILPWIASGGIAIKHSSASDSIARLEEILQEGYPATETPPIEELEK